MDLSRIDLNLLVSLDTLLAELNVTKAASRLHISQPAMSAQLSRLRELMGDPLLVPIQKGRSMTPTARALALRGPLRAALITLGSVIQSELGFDPWNDKRVFRIAACDTALSTICEPLIASIAKHAGTQIQVSLNAVDPGLIGRQMEEGVFDLLIDSSRGVPLGMRCTALRTDEFVMAQRKGHPRGSEPLTLGGYCELNHLVVSPERESFRGYMDEYLRSAGMSRKIYLTVPTAGMVPGILMSTDLVCTMPRMLTQSQNDAIETFELPFESEPLQLMMAWHPRDDADAAILWLRQLAQSPAATIQASSSDTK
ncbi:LysR family transcriptional regulator [Pseudomonas sp. WHRI 8519]|uniref:LysR family transcriptional regulator n=1 Tax=Pseudomonas sp. WHRI 8519 TaxID=3162567 RepID=UPI0032EC5EFA